MSDALARSDGCITCAWHGTFGDLCYCPEVIVAGRVAQAGLFDAPPPWWDFGRCALTGHEFRRLHLGERSVGGCGHWLGIRDRTDDMPWLEHYIGREHHGATA